MAYFSLVLPNVEYCCTVWDPFTATNINKLEMVQRRAARYVSYDYDYKSSVSSMLNQLGWRTLEKRRRDARLSMFYKIENSLVSMDNAHFNIKRQRRGCCRGPKIIIKIFNH